MMHDFFAGYHPVVNFIFFSFVLGFAMFLNHPLTLMISCICSVAYAISVEGGKAVKFSLKLGLPAMLLAAFINPAFNHEGVTILGYLPTGNPLTLESILYGLYAGMMIATVLIWFKSFHRVFTSDKFIYLFGRVIPALSLVLSMTLRYIPRFKEQFDLTVDAQRCIGRDISSGSIMQRLKIAIKVFSIMITWSLESAIDTADSMKSRGYGLKGRTSYSNYRFDDRDKKALLWLSFCGLYIFSGAMADAFGFRYFPSIRYAPINVVSISFFIIYFAMCLSPVIWNTYEERKWKCIISTI